MYWWGTHAGLWNEEKRFTNLPLTKDSTVVYVGANNNGADGNQIMDLFNWYSEILCIHIHTFSMMAAKISQLIVIEFREHYIFTFT